MIVVDCSFVLDLLARPSSVGDVDASQEWCAPELLAVEVASGVRGLLLGGEVDDAVARQLIRDFHDLGIRLWPTDPDMQERILDLAHNVTAHDAAYVVLAEALDAPLVTHDRRLAAAAAGIIHVLVDEPSPAD